MSTEVISVRVDKRVKEEAARLGIDVRQVVESALEDAVSRRKETKVIEAIKRIKHEMKDVTEEEWVQAIKNSRKRKPTSSTS